jgi:hypothetical protein
VIEAIVVGLLALVGVVVTQWFLHRRWTAEQDTKREEMLTRLATERQTEADRQDAKRQSEQAEILSRMAEQNSAVVNNALKVAEVHQQDADTARRLAVETARNHSECRQEVATLAGKVEELRARITETERTAGQNALATERHRDLKHKALSALTVSEGYVELVKKLVPTCTCSAFASLDPLTSSIRPRTAELLAENTAPLPEETP